MLNQQIIVGSCLATFLASRILLSLNLYSSLLFVGASRATSRDGGRKYLTSLKNANCRSPICPYGFIPPLFPPSQYPSPRALLPRRLGRWNRLLSPAWFPRMVENIGLLRHCDLLYYLGHVNDGVYVINVGGDLHDVFCEFQRNGYNWLVFQRRVIGYEDFFRVWKDYEFGFGDRSGEFWLGLYQLRQITCQGSHTIRIDIGDFEGNTAYAEYSSFTLGSDASDYTMNVSGYSGTAGDSLSYHSGRPFSTKDRDNDAHHRNCAVEHRGAWWYNSCQLSNLNGGYLPWGVQSTLGINWFHWKQNYYSMQYASMKVRPNI